ncbi:MAG: hypothetical protein LPK80_10465 [Bacteroidota bacterium]|nr:hypothetical protein [Bacteroidota bacterium]MDX5448330.1 hypothetical protein [Bacteroidota bacterium]
MGKLVISRGSDLIFRKKEITVFLDGIPVGKLGVNETKEFKIPPGDHMVEASMKHLSSYKDFFHISRKEIMAYQVTCPGMNLLVPTLLILILLFGLWHSDVFEERSLNLFSMIFPGSALILYMLYERKTNIPHLQQDHAKTFRKNKVSE